MLVYQRIVLREPSRTKKNSTLCRLSTWVHGRRVFFFFGTSIQRKELGLQLTKMVPQCPKIWAPRFGSVKLPPWVYHGDPATTISRWRQPEISVGLGKMK